MRISLCLFGLLMVGTVHAADALKQDNIHVRTWNAFADNVYKLHEQLISTGDISIKKSEGGYAQNPDFYIEEAFYRGDRLISKVQWEKENPDQLHTIEAYIHDDKGRVIRDYIAAYLPVYHNAPTQTLITLHRYNNDLHAFRSFDASGYRVIERCTGMLNGQEVNLLLDEDEIYEALDDPDPNSIINSTEYKQCFGDLQTEAGKYLIPN